jgi:hypothetical protein
MKVFIGASLACPSPSWSLSSKSELPVIYAKGRLFGIGQCWLHKDFGQGLLSGRPLIKSESLPRGGGMTMTRVTNSTTVFASAVCVGLYS